MIDASHLARRSPRLFEVRHHVTESRRDSPVIKILNSEFTTPTTLNLERKNTYVLTFTASGYNPATFSLRDGIGTGTLIADVLLTGVVGVIVDAVTGSWYGLEPETANVTLTRATTGGSGPEEIHIRLRQSEDKGHVEVNSDAPGVSVSVRRN
jgi:hypothetical protein